MKKCIDLTAYLLILLVFYSCNGDVFVDDFRSSDSELTLDGNGDVAVIRFASSNWDLLIYTHSDNFSYPYKIYDVDGNLTTTGEVPYLEGLGKIVCDEELTGFTIERSNSKELKITVDENARSIHFQFMIMVGNEYEYQEIYVDISPSDRYVFDRITYSLDAYSYKRETYTLKDFVQTNSSDIFYSHVWFPYENARYEVAFGSNRSEAFQLLGKDNLTVEIPSLEDGRLGMNGKQAQYTSMQQTLPFPNTEQVEVPIPPNSIQHIILKMDYEWFETEYTLYATQPKTGKQRIITGMLQSKIPGKYYLIRENLK
ncbi:hypothetical protein [Bacteroides faecium]|uniref:Uncharacterized protein n=1 Tax=Bacteroides faecium TaxID=2715212 RepID=A0A6H0KKB8_9BACE|nr:hypothetical protein [Bacteroides faecium]QIU93842.1 hypothetical protein BacF7301_06635 [Bacteroides faecium]